MVKAGLPILNVLSMLRDQIEHPTMKDIIEDVRKSLEGGITLSKCFEKLLLLLLILENFSSLQRHRHQNFALLVKLTFL